MRTRGEWRYSSTLDGNELSASRPAAYPRWNRPWYSLNRKQCVRDTVKRKRVFCPSRETNSSRSTDSPSLYRLRRSLTQILSKVLLQGMKRIANFIATLQQYWPPLWSSGQFLATDPEIRVRFPELPHFLRSSGSEMGSPQPRGYNWGATWKKK
jgi:hypothetical protein